MSRFWNKPKPPAGGWDIPTSPIPDSEICYTVDPPRFRGMDSDLIHQSSRGSAVGPEPHAKHSSLAKIAHHRIEGHESELDRPTARGALTEQWPIAPKHSIAPGSAWKNTSRREERVSTYQTQTGETRLGQEGTTSQAILLERENRDLKEELQRMRGQISQLEAQCNGQLAALREAQEGFGERGRAFGTTANATSTADVRDMMDELDAEIFHIATALSNCDVCEKPTKSSVTAHQAVDSELYSRMTRILGGELVNLLSANDGSHATPEIVVQVAFQTAMSTWSYMLLGSWILAKHSDDSSRFLAELYGEIWHSEDSKDASRWRVMARKRLVKRASPSDLRASLLQHITDVVILTTPRNEEPISRRAIEAQFGDRMEAAVRLVLNLNRDIGTNIVSEDFEAFLVDPGTAFESKTMENMWPKEGLRQSNAETVVCTTSLGLRKRGHNGGPAVVLMKPQVLLRSTLGQLMT